MLPFRPQVNPTGAPAPGLHSHGSCTQLFGGPFTDVKTDHPSTSYLTLVMMMEIMVSGNPEALR